MILHYKRQRFISQSLSLSLNDTCHLLKQFPWTLSLLWDGCFCLSPVMVFRDEVFGEVIRVKSGSDAVAPMTGLVPF